MPEEVYALDVASGGQNNQKLAILGLITLAQEKGATFRAPDRVRDWTPTEKGKSGKVLGFSEAYDEDFFKEVVGASVRAPTNIISHIDCFLRGAKRLSESGIGALSPRDSVSEILSAIRPAPAIQEEVSRLISRLPPGIVAVQLRIERDWQEHAREKNWLEGNNGDREIVLRSRRIFEKIRAQEDFRDVSQLLVCCDEDDLLETRQKIAEGAREFGFDVYFKSQLSNSFEESRLKRSLLDFGLCLAADRFVGSCLSTFANVLCLSKAHEICDIPRHYIYDAASGKVLQRYDFGRSVSPSRALSNRPSIKNS